MREGRGEQFASLGTGSIVAFPAPACAIGSMVVTTGRIVQRRIHPIVKTDGAFASNQFPQSFGKRIRQAEIYLIVRTSDR